MTAERAQIVRDSVLIYRDSVIYRLVRDSTAEKEKTAIFAKHDSVTGKDTVFVVTELIKERWRMRHDTIKVMAVQNAQKKEAATTKEQHPKSSGQPWCIYIACAALGVFFTVFVTYTFHKVF